MSLTQNSWLRRFGLGAIAAISLSTAVMSTTPAHAQNYGYRGPVVGYHAAYFPRFFFRFGGEHHWDHRDHWDHRWR